MDKSNSIKSNSIRETGFRQLCHVDGSSFAKGPIHHLHGGDWGEVLGPVQTSKWFQLVGNSFTWLDLEGVKNAWIMLEISTRWKFL